MTEPARREDWKTSEMPEAAVSLEVDRRYTPQEFARLRFGVVPRSMEEKWFVFYEAPWLYLHRSWTGLCVYQVRFEEEESGARVAEAIVNRDAMQYGGTSPAGDATALLYLLDSVIERNARYRMET